MTVFKFNIWFNGNYDDTQVRYIVANTEAEAEEKLVAYRNELVNSGFANFTYAGAWVEICSVII